MRYARNHALFLSLRPEYADLILRGTKRVELRRIRPRAVAGTQVVIYAASPVKSVLGGCEVSGVTCGEPDEVWDLHGALSAVDREGFDSYFDGAAQAVAIRLRAPWRLARPVPLSALRATWDGFTPPQSFRYVPSVDFNWLAKRARRDRRAS